VNRHRRGCWLWTGSSFRTGRGQFRIGAMNRQAHRVAWELTFGSSPPGLLRSKCGDLQCVRPDHQVVVDRKAGATNLARTPVKRFEAMVRRGPGCWAWIGSTVDGYGQFSREDPGGSRRMIPAHRFAWESAFGAIPDGADVHHRCGNRACVRPDHLVLWDPAEALKLPTPRQLDVLRAWVRSDKRYGSNQRVAAEVGLRPQSVASQMWQMRERLGVASNREAVAWLDEHRPQWRDAF
jgi:DNA-binding CsgD family transcriptional regulator